MNLMKKTYLSTAMAVALAGATVAPVGASTLSINNLGDAGIIPYYTVRDGWMTDFYIINTSGKTVAAKIRYHEALNSREVLDFIVVLSPYDMISAYVTDSAKGPVLMFPAQSESSCVVPIPDGRNAATGYGGSLPFSALRYTGAYDDTGAAAGQFYDIDRAREGYFTVVEMGTSDKFKVPGTVAYNSLHPNNSGKPRDCLAVENAFRVENIADTYNEFDRNENNLKIGWSLTNVGRGTQGSNTAVMIANFGTAESDLAPTLTSQLVGTADSAELAALEAAAAAATKARKGYETQVAQATGGVCKLPDPTGCSTTVVANYDALLTAETEAYIAVQTFVGSNADKPRNLISAQDPIFEEQPDLNSGDRTAYWIDEDENNPVVVTAGYWAGVDAVTALLMHTSAINEWANNPQAGSASDFVLTAPTKHYYVDRLFSGSVTESYAPFLGGEFMDEGGQSCDRVTVDYLNNDEVGTLDPVLPSPSPEYNLCYEVNVLHGSNTTSVLRSELAIPVDMSLLANTPDWNGWMKVNFRYDGVKAPGTDQRTHNASWASAAGLVPPYNHYSGGLTQYGLPIIGFNIKERDMGVAANAYSGITPHSYEGASGEANGMPTGDAK
jgi:hypothetical protein